MHSKSSNDAMRSFPLSLRCASIFPHSSLYIALSDPTGTLLHVLDLEKATIASFRGGASQVCSIVKLHSLLLHIDAGMD